MPEEQDRRYYVLSRSWYYVYNLPQWPVIDDILLYPQPGAEWKIELLRHVPDKDWLRLCIFDESWGALASEQGLLEGLAGLGKSATLESVEAVLQAHGFRDATQTEREVTA